MWGEPPAAERGEDERDGGGLQGEHAPTLCCLHRWDKRWHCGIIQMKVLGNKSISSICLFMNAKWLVHVYELIRCLGCVSHKVLCKNTTATWIMINRTRFVNIFTSPPTEYIRTYTLSLSHTRTHNSDHCIALRKDSEHMEQQWERGDIVTMMCWAPVSSASYIRDALLRMTRHELSDHVKGAFC